MNFAQPFQDYEILDRLGAGAMGTVFKARHKKLGRIVALKVLKPSLARDERYVDRLRREARIVASLNHPNVVAGYDLGEEGGYHFFVMELAEGKSLRSLLAEWGMFPEQQVLSVATQVTAALDHAFQRGVIHRDVKPGNILIDDKGNVKLTDMGLAKGPTDLTLTKDGATVGTPQYISPEQARNPQAVDIRSDLYSLGATLYHMATGQPPFRAETLAELITKVLSEPVRSPQELNPELSTGLSLVIRKLLAKDLTVRYQTPRELLDDLERVGRNEAPGVDPGRLDEDEPVPVRRPLLRVSVGIGLLLAVLAGVWVGSRVRADGAPDMPADMVFQQRLDQELRELHTPGERWLRLQAAADKVPPGQAAFLREREAQMLFAIQTAVDNTVQSFMVERRAEMEAWLCDASRWPDAAAFVHELLSASLHEKVGLAREALPTAIHRATLDELQGRTAEVIALRDAGLLRDFDGYVAVPLTREVQELLRRQDFAAAQARWDEGLQAFLDGRATGLLGRLPDSLLQELRSHFTAAHAAGVQVVERSEQDAAAALQSDVEEGLRLLEQAQKDGASRPTLATNLAALRARLSLHPPPVHFGLRNNPWPRVEQLLQAFDQRLDLMLAQSEQARLDWCLDMAYRTLCAGSFSEAADLLRAVDIEDAAAGRDLQRHRDTVEAAREVADGILAGLERSSEPVQGFPRTAPLQPVQLRVVRDGNHLRLRAELPVAPRDALLTEFRLPDLIARAERAGGLTGIPSARRDRGNLVLAMVADDLTGMDARLQSAGDEFLLVNVWQRIRRIRGEQSDGARPDRAELWTRVMQAWTTAQHDRSLTVLQDAIDGLRRRFKDTDLEPAAQRELKRIETWLHGERARQQLEARLRAEAPSGDITVQGEEAALEASVRFGFAALRSFAGEGWNPVDQPCQMVRANAASGEDRKRLEVFSGMPAGTGSCTCTAVLWLPPVDGDRIWLFEFRGVSVLLAVAQDGSVGASLLDPDYAVHADAVPRGVKRALSGFFGPAPRPHCVPGALHKLTIDIPGPGHGKVRVRVLFEEAELLAEQREVDGHAPVSLRLLPTQALGVAAVEFHGRGL